MEQIFQLFCCVVLCDAFIYLKLKIYLNIEFLILSFPCVILPSLVNKFLLLLLLHLSNCIMQVPLSIEIILVHYVCATLHMNSHRVGQLATIELGALPGQRHGTPVRFQQQHCIIVIFVIMEWQTEVPPPHCVMTKLTQFVRFFFLSFFGIAANFWPVGYVRAGCQRR